MKLAIAHVFTLMAVALVLCVPARSAAQGIVPPGFTQESFALLKQRAEAGDPKAKELYQKVLASTSALGEAVKNSVEALGALDSAKAEIQKAEASTGILTESMLKGATDAFVVNGFFVGMPLADAHARLANLLPGRKVSHRPPGGVLSEATQRGLDGLWIDGSDEAFCLAENGRVVRLLIPGPLVVEWLGLQSSSYEGRADEIARKLGCSATDEKDFEKSGYGKGHALQFKQRLYRLGLEGRVTYFGEAIGSSDIGATKEGRNPYFDGWLKNLRALGENASEGTLRIDAKGFKMPDRKQGAIADASPKSQPMEPWQEQADEGAGGPAESPANAKSALPGLFGAKFGSTMPADQKCETNNLFSLAYKYVPEKAFNEFTDYVIFASPKTRTIYQVRGIYLCATFEDAKSKIAEVAPILEMKFGRRLQKDGDGQVMRFSGDDRIEVAISQRDEGYSVLIDAVSGAYDIQDTEESMALKDEFAKSFVAPLGKTLDEVLPPTAVRPVNEAGDYLAPLPGVLKANGFNDMSLRLLPNTKRVGALCATASGNAGSCRRIFDRTKSHLQLVFGQVVQETQDGSVNFTAVVAGASYRFTLVNAAGTRVTLGIQDINAAMDDAKKAAASDLDAL